MLFETPSLGIRELEVIAGWRSACGDRTGTSARVGAGAVRGQLWHAGRPRRAGAGYVRARLNRDDKFGSLDGFRGDSSFRTWLFTIERRLMMDRRRAVKRRPLGLEIVAEDDAATEYDALDEVVAGEAESQVRAAVHRLTPTQREVFMLRVFQHDIYEAHRGVVVPGDRGSGGNHGRSGTGALSQRAAHDEGGSGCVTARMQDGGPSRCATLCRIGIIPQPLPRQALNVGALAPSTMAGDD